MGKVNLWDNTELLKATYELLEILDPVVDAYEFGIYLATLQNPAQSVLFLAIASFVIMFYEVAIPLGFIAFALLIQYNAYYQRRYVPHSITYTRNAKFIKDSVNIVLVIRNLLI